MHTSSNTIAILVYNKNRFFVNNILGAPQCKGIPLKLQGYLLKTLIIKILQRRGDLARASKNVSGNLVKQGITYITSHFAEDPSLNEVASALGVSPNHFSKVLILGFTICVLDLFSI